VVGTGPERAAGVVLVGVALTLAATGLVLRSLRSVRPLESSIDRCDDSDDLTVAAHEALTVA
ncbi:MAG TPA: hypothetical protein VGK49_11455, partial [Ilumatobacteraceae bacterium]